MARFGFYRLAMPDAMTDASPRVRDPAPEQFNMAEPSPCSRVARGARVPVPTMPVRLRSLVWPLLAVAAGPASACEAPTFVEGQAFYRDTMPVLAWRPVPGAVDYAVEIVSRVPEGPVVERRTLRTAQARTELPRLDASRATKITLTVTADCGGSSSAPATRVAVVAPAQGCAPVGALAAGVSPSGRTVSWRAVPGVDYELRAFDAVTGALTAHVQGPAALTTSIPGASPVVVAVRPRCGALVGTMSYLFVD